MVQEEREGSGELSNLTKRERQWIVNYPNGYDVPGSLKVAEDYVNTMLFEERVLEIGCGIGRVLGYLIKKKGIDATGVDINNAAIKHATENCDGKSKFYKMNGVDLKFADNSFDKVVMVGLVGGVEMEEREKLMNEAFRVVKPGGTVAIAEFKYNTDPAKLQKYLDAEEITHEKGTRIIKRGDRELTVKHFTEDELIGLFSKAKFTSIQTRGESIEGPGLGDGLVEIRRQYTVWGTKPVK
jgi:ubiquinone/menaquinone biosynthesis C-methylase UbiE